MSQKDDGLFLSFCGIKGKNMHLAIPLTVDDQQSKSDFEEAAKEKTYILMEPRCAPSSMEKKRATRLQIAFGMRTWPNIYPKQSMSKRSRLAQCR